MAFKTRYSYFEYQVMFLDSFNALANFWGYIKKVLIEKLDVFIIVYPDDILTYAKKMNYIDSIW